MTRRELLITLASVAGAAACRSAGRGPVPLDAGHVNCAYCRMGVTDRRFASQVLVPGDDPRFFDDLGCLGHFLADTADLPAGTRVYVADHRTRTWVAADRAIYTRVESLSASMGSHVIAHESNESLRADAAATDGTPVDAGDVLGKRALAVLR
jgi:copper chaperone NosL